MTLDMLDAEDGTNMLGELDWIDTVSCTSEVSYFVEELIHQSHNRKILLPTPFVCKYLIIPSSASVDRSVNLCNLLMRGYTSETSGQLFSTAMSLDKVEELKIDGYSNISRVQLEALILGMRSLVRFSASGSDILDDELMVGYILPNNKHLESIDISGCCCITDITLACIGESAQRLRSLNISNLR